MTGVLEIPVALIVVFCLLFAAALPAALPNDLPLEKLKRAVDDVFNRDNFDVNADHIRGKSATRDVLQSIIVTAILRWNVEKYVCSGGPEVYYSAPLEKIMLTCDLSQYGLQQNSFSKRPVFITHGMMTIGVRERWDRPLIITIIPCNKAYIDSVVKRDKYVKVSLLPIN